MARPVHGAAGARRRRVIRRSRRCSTGDVRMRLAPLYSSMGRPSNSARQSHHAAGGAEIRLRGANGAPAGLRTRGRGSKGGRRSSDELRRRQIAVARSCRTANPPSGAGLYPFCRSPKPLGGHVGDWPRWRLGLRLWIRASMRRRSNPSRLPRRRRGIAGRSGYCRGPSATGRKSRTGENGGAKVDHGSGVMVALRAE